MIDFFKEVWPRVEVVKRRDEYGIIEAYLYSVLQIKGTKNRYAVMVKPAYRGQNGKHNTYIRFLNDILLWLN